MNPLDNTAERLAQWQSTYPGDEPSFFSDEVPRLELDDCLVLAHGKPARLADHLGGCHQMLYFVREDGWVDDNERRQLHALLRARTPILPLLVSRRDLQVPGLQVVTDLDSELARRCDARAGTCYLLDPARQVMARWRRLDLDAVGRAMAGLPPA